MFQLTAAALWRRAAVRASRFRVLSVACLAAATVAGAVAGCASNGVAASCSSTLGESALAGGGTGGSQAGIQPAGGGQYPPTQITRPTSPAEPGAAAGLSTVATAGQAPRVSTVTLVTGDKVSVSTAPGGGQTATPVLPPATGPAATGTAGFAHLSWAGDQYVVPYQAVPYLGSLLDPRLFDVSYLARLQVGHRSAARVQVTGRSGTTAIGKLAGTPALGRLLASQWAAHRGGGPVAAGPLAGNARISLAAPAGAAAPAAPLLSRAGTGPHVPGVAYHTLTLNFTGPDGKSATALGWVQNVDDARLSVTAVSPYLSGGNGVPVTGVPGPVSVSVPDGTYSLQFAILTPHQGTLVGADATLVVKPQVTISSNETITLDARAAVPYHATLSGVTAPPLRIDELDVARISQAGGGCNLPAGQGSGGATLGLVSGSGDGYTASALSATPTGTVTEGTLGFNAMSMLWTGGSPTSPSQDPNYYLVFPDKDGIPSSLAFTVPRAQLTAVHEHIYSVPVQPSGGTSCSAPAGILLWPTVYEPSWGDQISMQLAAQEGSTDASWVSPGARTDYWYSGDPSQTYWASTFFSELPTGCFGNIELYGPAQRVSAGQQISQDWDKAPSVPGPAAVLLASDPGLADQFGSQQGSVAPAVRQDNNGMIAPLGGDSQPSHDGDLSPQNSFFTRSLYFYRNGTLVLSAVPFAAVTGEVQDFSGIDPVFLDLPLLPQAATYRLDWSTFPGTQLLGYTGPLTDRADTDWTFRSAPGGPAGSPPAGEACAPDPSRSCSFLPLLFISYNLPLSYTEQAVAGRPFPVAFTVEHQQGEAPPQGVSATVSASFDGGKTWTAPQAAVGTGGGRFTATVSLPALTATNGFASLRVTARDNAGNSVTQTIVNAFGLAS